MQPIQQKIILVWPLHYYGKKKENNSRDGRNRTVDIQHRSRSPYYGSYDRYLVIQFAQLNYYYRAKL